MKNWVWSKHFRDMSGDIVRLLISAIIVIVMVLPMALTSAFAADDDTITFPGHINVFNVIDPQGHGERLLQASNENTDFYSTSHAYKINLARDLAPRGWLTIENKPKEEGGTDNYWVRYTEIVPRGDTPRAVLPNDAQHRLNFSSTDSADPITRKILRFVPDDGTFIPPVQSTKIINLRRKFGLELDGGHGNYSAAYTFATVPTFQYDGSDTGKDTQDVILKDVFDEEWLPYNHYGNIVLFKTKSGPNQDGHYEKKSSWFWCINPNAKDPRDEYYFVREPTRFSGQTNFQDLPGMAFMLNIFNTIHDLGSGYSPDFRPLYKQLLAYYNTNMLDATHDAESFPWYPGLKNGEIRFLFDQLATLDGEPHIVHGHSIPVQLDHNAMAKPLPTETDWGNNRDFTNLGVAIEFYLTQHTQGIPLDHIDWLTAIRQAGIGRRGKTFPYNDEITMRALTRLLFAIEFAAKDKGLVQRYNPSAPKSSFKAEVNNAERNAQYYTAQVDLHRPIHAQGSKLLVAVTKGVNLPQGRNWKLYKPSQNDTFNDFYATSTQDTSLRYYEVPDDVKSIQVNYDAASVNLSDINDTPHPQIRFLFKSVQKVIGEVYASADSYEYNKASGHWLVKEYASYNHGMNTDQQIVSVTPHDEEVPQALALDLVDDAVASLNTTVSIDNVSSTETSPVVLRDDKRLSGKYSLVDTVTYQNMVPGAKYNLTGSVYKVIGEQDDKSTVGDPIITATQAVTVDEQGHGQWQLLLPTAGITLDPNTTYVVYETAVPAETMHNGAQVLQAEHEDPDDVLQTFVTGAEAPKPDITTAVSVGGKLPPLNASNTGVVLKASDVSDSNGIDVADYVLYKNLKPNASYTLVGKIYEVLTNNGSVPHVDEQKPLSTSNPTKFTASRNGRGFTRVPFGKVRGVQPGKKYVVFETMTLDHPESTDVYGTQEKPIEHKDPTDKPQTITVESGLPTLSTIVTAGSSTADDVNPAGIDDVDLLQGIPITDTVTYKNFDTGEYVVEGKLYAVTGQKNNYQIVGQPIALHTEHVNVNDESQRNGIWKMQFGKVKNLRSGARYVVFETAKRANQADDQHAQPVAEHADPNDVSQTIVVTHNFLRSVLPVTGGFGHYWYAVIGMLLILTVVGYLIFPTNKIRSLLHKK